MYAHGSVLLSFFSMLTVRLFVAVAHFTSDPDPSLHR